MRIMHLEQDKNKIKNALYVVSTPIGNLKDISFRAIEVLKNSDFILCEDTRVTKKLLAHYKIDKKLISNHKFNEKKNLNKILELLNNSKILSLVSDAGTPLISDPGYKLLQQVIKNKIKVFVIPGPSAITAALVISGAKTDNFLFLGFLPKNKYIEVLQNIAPWSLERLSQYIAMCLRRILRYCNILYTEATIYCSIHFSYYLLYGLIIGLIFEEVEILFQRV